ncbi:MAG: ABC transporter ATP-binding protein, partial [Alphaproteobacteria bacterium]|nr:ABC transporter ATP-binding protein [Alphaproteobacteria bacterium]
MTAILDVRDLVTVFHTDRGPVRAVDGVSFTIARGETLGIVGESGSGKSVTAQSIMRLLEPPARIEAGQVLFEGRDVLAMSQSELADWRGASAAMVFQDSLTGLNPVLRILPQVSEHVVAHGRMAPPAARRHGIDLLRRMGVASPERAAAAFPHQFSGGMRQRVMLAIGMANEPSLLIADEPTTALDVTIQAQILDLMAGLNEKFGTAIMLISHDLGV